MKNKMISCYNECGKKIPFGPPWFCSKECQDAYWKSSVNREDKRYYNLPQQVLDLGQRVLENRKKLEWDVEREYQESLKQKKADQQLLEDVQNSFLTDK